MIEFIFFLNVLIFYKIYNTKHVIMQTYVKTKNAW